MQILDVDYIAVNERPVIRIFGKTQSGESVCGFYEGFLPYFYVQGDAAAELLKDISVKQEKVRRKVVGRLGGGVITLNSCSPSQQKKIGPVYTVLWNASLHSLEYMSWE